MPSPWKWWIVILTDEDWYIIYSGYEIVKARSRTEAELKAKARRGPCHLDVEDVFGPFDERPKEA